jgi:hypothetical protein
MALNGAWLPLDDSRQNFGAKNSSGCLSKIATHRIDPEATLGITLNNGPVRA